MLGITKLEEDSTKSESKIFYRKSGDETHDLSLHCINVFPIQLE